MSLLYGIWRPQACPQTTDDCAYFANTFADWKCDYAGSAQLGPAAFGSRVFRIYSESKEERQPLADERKEIMLIADCRLDNREELANSLRLDSATLRQTPDSSLILQAYQSWGKNCFKRLEGDFAIAIWDQPKQELLLVRDVMGLRPLAYATWQDGFAFCSSIPELYQLPSVPPDLDEIKMAALFVGHPTGRERTAFESITWVHPGKIIAFRHGHITKQTFAEITPISLSKEDQKNPAPHLGELLKQSVQKRIRGDSDIVCELSGGFDSGAITALTATLLKDSPREVRAISWAPDPKEFPIMDGPDERKQIQWTEQHYGVKCSYHKYGGAADGTNDLNFHSSFTKNASKTIGSARTIISGWGGDECVTFYLRGVHPQALLQDGIRPAFKRLLADSLESKFGYRAPLRLIRAIPATWLTIKRRKQFRYCPTSIVHPALTVKWSELLATHHGYEILKGFCPFGTNEYILHLLTRGHLEHRASNECLAATRIGAKMTYPMLDVSLLKFAVSLDPGHFDYSSHRRQLFRNTLKALNTQLAPGTRKQEAASEATAKRSLSATSTPSSHPNEIPAQQKKYLGEAICSDVDPLMIKYRETQIQEILLASSKKEARIPLNEN